jgi:hypothetical protein
MTEAELERFVSYYAEKGHWPRADRRTGEGRAQVLALDRGWIEPMPAGSGYRVLVAAGSPDKAPLSAPPRTDAGHA